VTTVTLQATHDAMPIHCIAKQHALPAVHACLQGAAPLAAGVRRALQLDVPLGPAVGSTCCTE
jgi:hypothetical protein